MVIEGVTVLASIVATAFAALWLGARSRSRVNLQMLAEGEGRRVEAASVARQAGEEAMRLREALDALPVPVWRRNGAGALVDCNRAYAAALGASREVVLAENLALISKSETEKLIAPVCTDASSAEAHVVIAGRRRLLQITEASCAGCGTVGFALDRTDLESAQGELRRHILAHAAVLESLSAAVAIFGPDKRLKFFNTAFTGLWGFDKAWLGSEPAIDEILERLHESRRFPEYRDFRAFKRERCELFTSLIEPRQELMHLPDGRTLLLTISPHPFGGLTYLYDDVSDRLALECSYNTLAQVQRATLDHLFEGIAVYGGDGRLKLHNPAFRALWGLSEADVAGEPHVGELADKTRDLLDDGGDWAGVREEMVAQVTSQTLTSRPLYRRDGSMLQVASVPLPDGEVLLTYLDVSDGARVERALRERNEALETAGRLKTEFVANVSHELRTPLNSVIGFAEILHNQYFGPLNSSQREYSRGILDSAHQLMVLINDMIDLATIEAGYLELELGRVNIAGMLQAVIGLTRERAHSRGLDMELRCPSSIGAIEGDERRLKQALFNLISNAIMFTPPGGAIGIEAERRKHELLLSVAETPKDIAAANGTRRSERFERCRTPAGSGFGLSLVKSLVELHGGAVEIESVAGRGVRVICRLPAGRLDTGNTAALITTEPVCAQTDSPCEVAA
jgi:signal transduction histidine kinase